MCIPRLNFRFVFRVRSTRQGVFYDRIQYRIFSTQHIIHIHPFFFSRKRKFNKHEAKMVDKKYRSDVGSERKCVFVWRTAKNILERRKNGYVIPIFLTECEPSFSIIFSVNIARSFIIDKWSIFAFELLYLCNNISFSFRSKIYIYFE